MSRSHHTNEFLQQWLHSSIQNPGQNRESAQEIINSEFGIPPLHRLAIYQNGYRLRLLECLRAEYPLLIKAFSNEWFDMMATHYLNTHPSRSPNLNDLGANFPAFLQQDRPDKNEDIKDDAFELITHLAAFERARVETGRGKGSEGISFDHFDKIETRTPNSLRIKLSPNLRLLKVPFQLLAFIDALEQASPSDLVRQDQYIAVCRSEYQVGYFELNSWQFAIMTSLSSDPDLAAAILSAKSLEFDAPIDGLLPFFLLQAAGKGCLLEAELIS